MFPLSLYAKSYAQGLTVCVSRNLYQTVTQLADGESLSVFSKAQVCIHNKDIDECISVLQLIPTSI